MSRSLMAGLSLVLAVVGQALGGGVAAAETPEDLARDLRPSQRPLFELGGTKKESGVALDAWIDNPEHVYSVGQRLKVFVRPKETSYITVLNVGSSGRVAVIFPNHYQRNVRVRAGETVRIPAEGANWHIDVSGPPGVEVIKIIASREPLRLRELERLARTSEDQPLVSLDRTGEEVARDLVPQLESKTSGPVIIPGGMKSLLVRVVPRQSKLEQPGSHEIPGAFGLALRPERPVYKIGDIVRVAVAVEKDCRLSLISLGTSGQALRLFPNEFQPDNVIRAGQTILIPSNRSPVQFKARGPTGVEGLLAICSSVNAKTEPPPNVPGEFAKVGDVHGVTRDLVAAAAGGKLEIERVSGSFLITN
jgi:Domain of unknown function (DUF4384)